MAGALQTVRAGSSAMTVTAAVTRSPTFTRIVLPAEETRPSAIRTS